MRDAPVKIACIMWGSYVPAFLEAADASPVVDLSIFSNKELENDADQLEGFWAAARQAEALLLYWTNDGFWEEVRARLCELAPGKIIITTSFDPSHWGQGAGVGMEVCARAYAFLTGGGQENYRRLLEYVAHQVDPLIPVADPLPLPWQGIMHPPAPEVFDSVEDYRRAHPARHAHCVGLLFPRHSFTDTDTALERALMDALEQRGLDVLPVFAHGTPEAGTGALGALETARRYFLDAQGRARIKALINLQFFFLNREGGGEGALAPTVDFFSALNVPVFKPVISYGKGASEWEEDPQGLITDVTFGIAMPEFEGNIEPIIAACSRKLTCERTQAVFEQREVLCERVGHIAGRIAHWVRLAQKPPQARKVAFVLHKNECAGLEASLGGAAGLDTGASVVAILKKMQDMGYRVENIPDTGEELLQTFLERKAIAEFRWTTVDEIVAKGGHLALLDSAVYQEWFDELPLETKEALVETWGAPPGQELNGVPAAMIHDGKLVITGLDFGNVVVIMQPKRGCAGARCDGQVCKILHDPDLPPPHHYLATYRYLERVFQADAIVHVGTHGNLEWLPGKGAGLSKSCWPDIAIGHLPNLYIYNADNPAEGVIAKRRSYATLVDHLQALLSTADTYGELEELEDLLDEHTRARAQDAARAHQLEHLVKEAIERAHLWEDLAGIDPTDFDAIAARCHAIISRVKNSQTRLGMHTFGELPHGAERAEVINTILRFDSSSELNTRRLIFELWGEDIGRALKAPGERSQNGQTYSRRLYAADRAAVSLIASLLESADLDEVLPEIAGGLPEAGLRERLARFAELVREIDRRLESSREIDSLLNALGGGHVPAGPSGYLSRGRWDILPTGRNFSNVDPTRIPTRAAQRVGVILAEALLERHLKEEGRYPETVGMVWLASDIMRADGEQICQILHLLGVRPTWKANGQVAGFEVIPARELARPRIDVNIRVSGITRDCFPEALTYVDRAVQAVATLEEGPEENFIRRHILAQASGATLDDKDLLRRLSYRIFCAQPGVYKAGVNLAVAASAWKGKDDLADVYVFWNGYAYGGEAGGATYGVPAHQDLVENLRRVEVTFDKHISDEGDFLNCCGFYGNYGGMTAAVGSLSGRPPKTYYGDTRDPAQVQVTDFADEMRRVVRTRLLHPKYIEGMQAHGYKGAGDLAKRIGRVYGFGATTGQVDNWIFDEIAETFVLERRMQAWFQEVNPWALEEIGRRLLEAESRGVWQPEEELLERLREAYLETEACLEETLGEVQGEFQGGAVDVVTSHEVAGWQASLQGVLGKLDLRRGEDS